jgi:hypothetical protein
LLLAGPKTYSSETKTSPKALDDFRFTSTLALFRERGFCVLGDLLLAPIRARLMMSAFSNANQNKLVNSRRHAELTATIVTTAAFAKTFVPFYLIGSTAIFAATCASGAVLVAVGWRQICAMARKIPDVLVVLTAFYALVLVGFLIHSRPAVPITHVVGILAFHGLFMIFGFSAARAPKAVLGMLLCAAVIYLIVIVQYIARFGDLMQEGHLQDIFGLQDPEIFETLYQNIGIMLGLAALAGVGLSSNRIRRIFVIGALPLLLLFLFHISARGALVAFVCSLVFLAGAALWVRSKKLALFAAVIVFVAAIFASALSYQHALQSKNLGSDTISRTIREIQHPTPGLRLDIWTQAWHRISSEPDRLLFGRGVGMYPVIESFGAPDWLLRKTEASRHYPHNVYLEMLYETGIVGLLLFGILTLLPLVLALGRWHLFSLVQKSAISMYVFHLISSQFSGSFAFGYLDQFFFAFAVGIVALSRTDDVLVGNRNATQGA